MSTPLRTARPFLIAVAIAAVAGLALAAELTHVHHETHTNDAFRAVCTLSERVNCQTVAMSSWSTFAGVPVSVWGLIAYATFFAVATWGASKRRPHESFGLGIIAAMSVASVASSVLLGFVSLTILHSICIFCFALYGINAVIAVLVGMALYRARLSPLAALAADIRALVARPVAALGLTGALAAAVATAYALTPDYGGGESRQPSTYSSGVTERGEHWLGATDPSVVIYEYTDYQCPHCRRAHRELRNRLENLGERVRVVHKHYPLDHNCNPGMRSPFHERACEFSRFVECAGEQQRFWEANDAVFAALDRAAAESVDLGALASQIGIEMSAAQTCMAQLETSSAIARDIADGDAAGVQGTPSYVINNELHVGAVPAGILDAALAPR